MADKPQIHTVYLEQWSLQFVKSSYNYQKKNDKFAKHH